MEHSRDARGSLFAYETATTSSGGITRRTVSACVICHKKKVKCDLSESYFPCTNCNLSGYTCKRRERKRKHYTTSPTPPPRELRATSSPRDQVIVTSFATGPQRLPDDPIVGSTDSVEAHTGSLPALGTDKDQTLGPEESYLGRREYLAADVPFNETRNEPDATTDTLLPVDMQVLRLQKAFELPTRSIQSSLIDNFMTYCNPWTPIVERSWLEVHGANKSSLLLLQAVFLAGSRVSSGPLINASSQDFYRRAKALFYCGYEKNTMITIIATCLLHWWNPAGPEQISPDTSQFWLRMGVGFAYQIGLHREPAPGRIGMIRRRLWWSLVARDSMISAALGRPRSICIQDSDARPPSVEDFPAPSSEARLFVAYVKVCQLMGDLTECRLRKKLDQRRRVHFENAVYRWVSELPPELKLFRVLPAGTGCTNSLNTYNFEARQLLIHYFVILVILHGSSAPHNSPSAISILAASFICGIFESFLARDEIRYLRANFAFLALAAGLSQLSSYRYAALRATAEHEVSIIKLSLQELSKKWRSAEGALKSLGEVSNIVSHRALSADNHPRLSPDAFLFFEDFGPDLCRHWHSLHGESTETEPQSSPSCRQQFGTTPNFVPEGGVADLNASTNVGSRNEVHDPFLSSGIPDFDVFGDEVASATAWPAWGSIGTWLLND